MFGSWKVRLELATRCGALLLGGAYIAGLLVVNLHLQRYGAFVLTFNSPQYLAAGIWSFVPILLVLVLAIPIIAFLRPVANEALWLRAVAISTGVLFWLLALASMYFVGSMLDVKEIWWWVIYLPAAVALGIIASSYRRAKDSNGGSDDAVSSRAFLASLFIPLILMGFVGHFLIFAGSIYPTIPARWGGGEPVRARLTISSDKISDVNPVLAPERDVLILLMTASDIVVQPLSSHKAVILRKELVDGVWFQ